jgi:hypothetical protein
MIRLNLSIKDAYLELIQAEHLDKLYELFELNRDYLRRNIPGVDLIQLMLILGIGYRKFIKVED